MVDVPEMPDIGTQTRLLATLETTFSEATPASADNSRGTLIGRYVVLSTLGEGGMGVVLAAYDPELDRKIALKLLKSLSHSSTRARLQREAQALAKPGLPKPFLRLSAH